MTSKFPENSITSLKKFVAIKTYKHRSFTHLCLFRSLCLLFYLYISTFKKYSSLYLERLFFYIFYRSHLIYKSVLHRMSRNNSDIQSLLFLLIDPTINCYFFFSCKSKVLCLIRKSKVFKFSGKNFLKRIGYKNIEF